MREVCFLVGEGGVLWSDVGESAVAIPDSRERWDAIWRLRGQLIEIAHSHPVGPLGFSHEDETTMSALTSALGRRLVFSVVAPRGMVRRVDGENLLVKDEPEWAKKLRRESGMESGS